jgi:phage-related tail fiber protein
MANTVRIKRRASGSPGAPTSLANAELAYNEVDDVLYYGKGTGGAGGTATTIPAIAGAGAYLTLSTTQTVSGAKTFTGDVIVPTQTSSDNSTKAATTAFVKAQGYLTGNQSITFSGDATGSGTTSVSLTLASVGTAGTYTKVTTDAKGRVTAGTTLAATDIPTLTAAKISDFDTQVRTSRLDQMAAPTADVSLNSRKITNLADPTGAQDAATKAYVDATKQGLDVKDSVRVATTGNITLSGTQTIDGISVVAGNRVLVKDQSTASANGIYVVVSGGSWTRANDFDTSGKVTSGAFTFVEEGTANADSGWVLTTDGAITLGTTNLTFTQFSGAGQITAGAGLTKTGSTIDVGTASTGRIVVNADNIDLATTGVSAGTFKSVTVDAYGRITAGTNPTTLSGYGITDAQPLDATLTALAGLTTAANQLIYSTAADAFAMSALTSFGRSLIDDADAAAGRTTLGLGTMATQAANNVNITGGSIDNVTIDGGTF